MEQIGVASEVSLKCEGLPLASCHAFDLSLAESIEAVHQCHMTVDFNGLATVAGRGIQHHASTRRSMPMRPIVDPMPIGSALPALLGRQQPQGGGAGTGRQEPLRGAGRR